MELTPSLVLAMWTAGLAGAGAAVAWWRIVGPGYTWLVAGTVAAFGVFGVVAGGGPGAVVGIVAAVVAGVLARRPESAAITFGVSALGFVVTATMDSRLGLVVTGALFVGGITSEMLLGHWYLVDPRLPRWALYRLAAAAAIGLVVDTALLTGRVVMNGLAADVVFAWAYAALAATTALLIAGVWFSLKEPQYAGVMAATGLSYLAVLTSLGVLVLGRLIAYG
jgi:hypothetical protein